MGIFDKVWDVVTDIGHAVTGMPTAAEKRTRERLMNDQIAAYKRQTELAESEIARKREEQLAEKRRIEEKQVRSLRRNFRPAGFLDSGSDGMSNKLG